MYSKYAVLFTPPSSSGSGGSTSSAKFCASMVSSLLDLRRLFFNGLEMEGTATQNEQSTGRYSQLTTLLQTASSRPDSGDYVQGMSAEPYVHSIPGQAGAAV